MADFYPGFRFYPTEEELVAFYLRNKLEGGREDLNRVMDMIIPVLDIYEYSPWELPQISGEMSNLRDPEQWFFFIPRQESEARGGRPRRLTDEGYWKATGSPGKVYSNNYCVGVKRTMVFYTGRAPNGKKTDWKMNEYKLTVQGQGGDQSQASSSSDHANPSLRHEFSLCRVYKNSKCLRSFDRRPVEGSTWLRETVTDQPVAPGGHEASTSHQNPPMVERQMNSPNSSSSEEQGDPNDPLMSIDDEIFLDLGKLDNWFCGGDDSQPK